jgi:hypothetical protein
VGLRRRHDLLAVGRENADERLGVIGVFRIPCECLDRRFADVEPEILLTVILVRAVAVEALVGKYGQYLAGVGNLLLRVGNRGDGKQAENVQ